MEAEAIGLDHRELLGRTATRLERGLLETRDQPLDPGLRTRLLPPAAPPPPARLEVLLRDDDQRAPYVAKRTYTGAQPSEETIALSQAVSTRDLNLQRAWDRGELFRRVDYAARDVCRDLKRLYPEGSTENCLSDARRTGYRQANYLIQIRG